MMKDSSFYVNNLNVLYEDNHIIVIEKFINVLSQKDQTNDIDMTDILKAYLKEKYNKPGNVYLGLIHRLDRRVGGVMVFAKTSKAASRLSEDIRDKNFNKYYYALVKGVIKEDGKVEVNILKDEYLKLAKVDSKGKESLLYYKVIKSWDDKTKLDIDLVTGRYNQIRVSMAYINHPLINDYKYDKDIKPNNLDLGLWCHKVSLVHPTTKKQMEFSLEPKGSIWE